MDPTHRLGGNSTEWRRRSWEAAYRLEGAVISGWGERGRLDYYAKSLWYSPRYAWKHWQPYGYESSVSLAKKIGDRFLLPASAQRKQQTVPAELKKLGDWPGLNWKAWHDSRIDDVVHIVRSGCCAHRTGTTWSENAFCWRGSQLISASR